jgi:uncharacterized protein (TIGR03067 family)
MSLCGVCVVMGSLLAAGDTPVGSAPKGGNSPAAGQEIAKLQGTWRAVKFTVGGRSVDPNRSTKKAGAVALELHGDYYEFKGLGIDFKGQIRIDASAQPKRIEFVRAGGLKSVSTYELDDGLLKLTGVNENQPEATAAKAPDVWVFRLERP